MIRLQEDDDAEGLFGGFAGTGDRDGAGWRFAARGGGGIFRCGQNRGQVAAAVGGEWQRRGETARRSVSPLEVHATVILEVVRAQPDAAFVELLVALKKRGIRTSRSALWRFFARHDITFKKKSLCASERKRQDVVRARRKWIREQGLLDPARLVFIDESA
jgi:transposase